MRHRPLHFEGRFLWHNGDHMLASCGSYFDHLPGDVFDRLDGHIDKPDRLIELVKTYPTRKSAMDALRRALGKTS